MIMLFLLIWCDLRHLVLLETVLLPLDWQNKSKLSWLKKEIRALDIILLDYWIWSLLFVWVGEWDTRIRIFLRLTCFSLFEVRKYSYYVVASFTLFNHSFCGVLWQIYVFVVHCASCFCIFGYGFRLDDLVWIWYASERHLTYKRLLPFSISFLWFRLNRGIFFVQIGDSATRAWVLSALLCLLIFSRRAIIQAYI